MRKSINILLLIFIAQLCFAGINLSKGGSGGITDAPSDGTTYGRKDAGWTAVTVTETDPVWAAWESANDNHANWDTAYGWGDHAGLYLGLTAKAADADTLDGHDTAYFQTALGYTAESTTNKSTDRALGSSTTLYPSQSAVRNFVLDALFYNSTWDAGNTVAASSGLNGICQLSNGWVLSTGVTTGKVYTSTDFGITWNAGVTITGATGLRSILQLANGWVFCLANGSKKIFKSTDNAATWDAGTTIGAGAADLYCLTQDADGIVYASSYGESKIYKSADNCATWDGGNATPTGFIGIKALSNGKIAGCGYSTGKVYLSTDNAATWDAGVSVGTTPSLYGINQLLNGDVGVTGYASHRLYISTDNCISFDIGRPIATGTPQPRDFCQLSNSWIIVNGYGTDKVYKHSAILSEQTSTTAVRGLASFSSTNFSVAGGHVSINPAWVPTFPGALISTTSELNFRDTEISINSSVDGRMDLTADTSIYTATPLIGNVFGTLPPAQLYAQYASMTFNTPNPVAQRTGLYYDFTTAGSAAAREQGMYIGMGAGYTGSNSVISIYVDNVAASTGNSLSSWLGNYGLMNYVHGTTSGLNVGSGAWADNGNLNIAILGEAPTAKNSAVNIGVAGFAINTGTSPVQIGGYFTTRTPATPSIPSVSAALIADNGSQTTDIVNFMDNGASAFKIADGGTASTQNVEPKTDNTYYLGKNDDDTPFSYKGLILKDTTNGKYYRIEIINGAITATDLTD